MSYFSLYAKKSEVFQHSLTICVAAPEWAGLTWRSSAEPSWDWAHGVAVQSGQARSEWFPGTRYQLCSHTERPSWFHTWPPLGPSWAQDRKSRLGELLFYDLHIWPLVGFSLTILHVATPSTLLKWNTSQKRILNLLVEKNQCFIPWFHWSLFSMRASKELNVKAVFHSKWIKKKKSERIYSCWLNINCREKGLCLIPVKT